MDADLERALADLVEARRLEEVLLRYFDCVDARDAVGASQFFTTDVEFEIMTGKQLQGRERYARALERVLVRYRDDSPRFLAHVATAVDRAGTVEVSE